MPIKIPDDLPARRVLDNEGVPVIGEGDAIRQDIRPMRIALLNLMPEKVKTETQLARVIGATPLQVEVTLLTTGSYTPTNTPSEHMLAFYEPWEKVADEKFDGLIVTGAPVEEIPFEDVIYWEELSQIFEWSRTNAHRGFNICWGAQAGLYHYYGIPKHALPQKLSGIFRHRITTPNSDILRGFPDAFDVPCSRYTETRREDVERWPQLRILAESAQAGLCLVEDLALNQVYMFNHLEYDTTTLADEYARDLAARPDARAPENYFPDDDPANPPLNTWRSHGHLLFANWINMVYQTTPFDLEEIGAERTKAHAAAE